MGSSPIPVPPHVFELDAGRLSLGVFARRNGGFETGTVQRVELPADTFAGGPLGGTLRSAAGFDHAVAEIAERADALPAEASLVLPDRWLRLLFVDTDGAAERSEEVLRWKLKKLVPFRVEDLRLQGTEVEATGEARVLVAFAVEAVLASIEDAFERNGVRVGQILSRTLALMALLGRGAENLAVVHAEEDGYSLFFAAAGTLQLVRYRTLAVPQWSAELQEIVARDFRIVRAFLRETLPGLVFARGVVCAPLAATAGWVELMEDCFELPTRGLGAADLPLDEVRTGSETESSWATLLGAACREIA